VSQYEDFEFLRESARTRSIPEKELVKLAKHPNRFIRWVVAYYDLTPSWILEYLSKDPHWSVRYAVAANANTQKAVVKYRLAMDNDPSVRRAAEENPLIDEQDKKEIFRMRMKKAYEGDFSFLRR